MEYIPVAGKIKKGTENAIPRYFKSYLVSMAEPTRSKSWTLHNVFHHTKKQLQNKAEGMNLYLDSGGYQIITGYIKENRIREYTDTYHFVLEHLRNQIDFIFSLDINTPNFTEEMLIHYNDYSIQKSIELIKKFPEIKDKQLFIVQSRVPRVLNDWLELMKKHSVEEYYDLYSFGGLVGLKSETRVQFNHFVPMTLWLLTYLKTHGNHKPKQIHMLGQSSRVAIITGAILEKLFDIKITMDSSEIVRFSPIKNKIPMMHWDSENFHVINDLADMTKMVKYHFSGETNEIIHKTCSMLLQGKVTNEVYNMLLCQNLQHLVKFSEDFVEKNSVEEILNWNSDDFYEKHAIFKHGRLSQEMANNMRLIRNLLPFYENGDFKKIHDYVSKIVESYYDGSKNTTGVIDER